jgi:hypothetical protein
MNLAKLRWPVLGLIVVVLGTYVLTKGLYIGSTIDVSMRQGEGKFLYSKSCRYLYLTGVRDLGNSSESPSREGAEAAPCAPLGSQN